MRLAALSDAPHAFGSKFEREVAAAEDVWRDRLRSRAQFLAELDGAVAGTAGGFREGDGTAELISMWVAPHARGKGAGEALVKAVVDWARAEGFPTIRLWVAHGNDRAEALYLRCGFARTGAEKAMSQDSNRMEFQMARKLR